MSYFNFNILSISAGVVFFSVSIANAGCIITAKNNATRNIPLGTCLHMSIPADFHVFGQSDCQGLKIIHDPSWNDNIVKIATDGPATITLQEDPGDRNKGFTTTFSQPGSMVLAAKDSAKATVLLCY